MATSSGSPGVELSVTFNREFNRLAPRLDQIRFLKRNGSMGFKHFERFFVSDRNLLKTLKLISVTGI